MFLKCTSANVKHLFKETLCKFLFSFSDDTLTFNKCLVSFPSSPQNRKILLLIKMKKWYNRLQLKYFRIIGYIFIILRVAYMLLLFIGWIFTKDKWKSAIIIELPWKHCSTTHNTAIIRMTSMCTYKMHEEKNRKQSTKSLIHWSQYIQILLLKIDMIQYWYFCFISPVSSGIKILPHYSEVKVICLATMTINTRFIANMDTAVKKDKFIYLSLILLWNPALLRRTVSSLFFILTLFKCSKFIWHIIQGLLCIHLRAEVDKPWPGGTEVPDPGL